MYSNSLLRNKDIHSQTIENGLKTLFDQNKN